MLSFRAATSPEASTVIDRVRSPFVTASETSAMARTWLVRLSASWFTLSVKSRQMPAAPGTRAWPPSLPSMPTSRATFVTCLAKIARVSIMPLMVSASEAISPLVSTVNLRRRLPCATAVTTAAMFRIVFKPMRFFSKATRVLVTAMEQAHVKRLICVTGFGAGDSRGHGGFLYNLAFHLLLGRVYDDKDVQERIVRSSKLQLTGAFAEFERTMIRQRIKAGLKRAVAQGVKLGRPKIDGATERKVRRQLAKGIGILKVAKSLGIGTGTVQRISGERAMSLRGAEQ